MEVHICMKMSHIVGSNIKCEKGQLWTMFQSDFPEVNLCSCVKTAPDTLEQILWLEPNLNYFDLQALKNSL